MELVERIGKWDKPIKIISTADAEGITAAALLSKALQYKHFTITSYLHVGEKEIHILQHENYDYYIFLNCGGNILPTIKQILGKKNIIIVDKSPDDFYEPTYYLLNKNEPIVEVYFLAIGINPQLTSLAYIPCITTTNKEIIQIAIENKDVQRVQQLKIFGKQTRSIHKALEYSTELQIPGITGNEQASIQFLESIGIPSKQNALWRKYADLTDEELTRLTKAIADKKKVESESIQATATIFLRQPPGPTKDAREFASLLKSCAKMEQTSVAIGTCLNDPISREKALEVERRYKHEVAKGVDWFKENKDTEYVKRGDGYIILNSGEHLLHTVTGATSAIISSMEKCLVLTTAHTPDDRIKVSLRGKSTDKITTILKRIIKPVNGISYGTAAYIKKEQEEEFFNSANTVLAQQALEESV